MVLSIRKDFESIDMREAKSIDFPILGEKDRPYIPEKGGNCPICGKSLEKEGIVYLSAGAVSEIPVDKDMPDPVLKAFFDVGYHGIAVDCSDCVNVCIVEDLEGGQFNVSFCSIQCLKKFFLSIVDALQRKLDQIRPRESAS
jgi:hypothetical protein